MPTSPWEILPKGVLSVARTLDAMLGAGGIQNARDAMTDGQQTRAVRAALEKATTTNSSSDLSEFSSTQHSVASVSNVT